MNDQNVINQREWENPANWRAGLVYRSRNDSRLLVPKRPNPRWPLLQIGETVNFGHRRAGWLMLGLSSVPLGFLLLFVLYQLAK